MRVIVNRAHQLTIEIFHKSDCTFRRVQTHHCKILFWFRVVSIDSNGWNDWYRWFKEANQFSWNHVGRNLGYTNQATSGGNTITVQGLDLKNTWWGNLVSRPNQEWHIATHFQLLVSKISGFQIMTNMASTPKGTILGLKIFCPLLERFGKIIGNEIFRLSSVSSHKCARAPPLKPDTLVIYQSSLS